jgi:ACS family allantoate permease-like MFS transporter
MFMIFGIVTVIFGISLWWILPDSPLTATFLSERERLIAVERLRDNKTGVKNSHHKKAQVKEAFLDPKIWLLVAAIFFHNMTNSLQTNFTGLIIVGLGYSSYDAVLLSIPPGIVQAATMIIVSYFLSTKWGQGKRILLIIICYIPGVACSLILYLSPIAPSTKSAHLFAIIFVPVVAVSAGITYSLLASNVAGYTKKTTSGSIFFMAYCVANIVSPQTFLQSQAPRYTTGIAITLAAFCINIVIFSVLYVVYRTANKRRDADPAAAVSVDATRDLIDAFSDLTDLQNKTMRYKM